MDRSTHIPVLEAARQLGVTPTTMRKRLDRAGVVIQLDPLDLRCRLIPRDVLPTLARPGDGRLTESRRAHEDAGAVA
jgi:hypothetical protein